MATVVAAWVSGLVAAFLLGVLLTARLYEKENDHD